ncbi:MAG TPA: TIGR03546 family protein [Planctomycetaceae bacterium]|nr:TIGR03546 family protein [Planctomycetaceae bacterium]
MWFIFIRPVRFLTGALIQQDSPRQLAHGFALGALVGLVPKENLTAIALMTVLCAARVNLGTGMLAAFAFSWIGVLVDPLSHRIGLSLLEWRTLAPVWTWLYNLPVVPWTQFNNSVVLGSLVVGLTAYYPLVRLGEPLFARYKPRLEERLRRYRIVQVLFGAEWTSRLGPA